MQRKTFMTLIFLCIVLTSVSIRTNAQGWSFTANLTYSGPCGVNLPTIPPIVVPSMPTRSYCESLRQTVLGFKSSVPVYNNQGQFIGECSVFYACSSCSGSDLTVAGDNSAPGSVSIDALVKGAAFFSPHESKAVENWIDDYVQKMQSMGIPINKSSMMTAQDIPLTGDADFDKFYTEQTISYEKPEQGGVVDLSGKAGIVDLNTPAVTTGAVVPLLTTSDEQRKKDEWMQEQGFNDLRQSGADNAIDATGSENAGRSWGDAALRTAIGQAPGLAGAIGDFMVNVADETISGVTGIVNDFVRGDDAQVAAKAKNLEGQIIFNSAKKTALNVVSDKATEIGYCPLLKLVPGAEPVYKVAKIGLDFYQNKIGE